MKVLSIQSSNRRDGLTASLAQAVLDGVKRVEPDAEVQMVHLCDKRIEVCRACGERGWGVCFTGEPCVIEDDFLSLVEQIVRADAVVFATPVYFWDVSESMKTFLDRLRRQEWARRDSARLRGKPVIGIAAAGGSGTGAPSAIRNLETYMTYLGVHHVVYLPVSRQNQEMQKRAAYTAGEHVVEVARAQQNGG